jgi:hypothetical protein
MCVGHMNEAHKEGKKKLKKRKEIKEKHQNLRVSTIYSFLS